jgi:uncharacterized Zn finger protein (UPF0148 family)
MSDLDRTCPRCGYPHLRQIAVGVVLCTWCGWAGDSEQTATSTRRRVCGEDS